MTDKKYFTFKKSLISPLIIQVENDDVYNKVSSTFNDLGLKEMTDHNVGDLKVVKESVILRVIEASAQIERKIRRPHALEKEFIVKKDLGKIYINTNNTLLLFSEAGIYWQMAVSDSATNDDLKVSFNRFLSLAFGKSSVIGFWGLIVKDKLLVTNKEVSGQDCFFIDLKNNRVFDSKQEIDLTHEISFARLDLSLKVQKRLMSKEELFCFLINNTSYFNLGSFPENLKGVLLNLAKSFNGFIYPENSFEKAPKELLDEA